MTRPLTSDPKTWTPGLTLLSLAGASNAISPYLADFNHTHVYNPRWPPHARFHNGMTMSMGLCLGVMEIYYSRRTKPSQDQSKSDLVTAGIMGSLYWVTLLRAILYPGSLATDQEFGTGFPQAWVALVHLGCTWGGVFLELKRLGNGSSVASGQKREKKLNERF